ncbi:MAG: diguanylate cyclase, partial [Microvirgula sp.]
RDVPIIVLSSRDDPKVKSAAFSSGANDYLVKLPDNIELVARIRYHSRSYLHRQQRDEAYRALRESQQKLLEVNLELQQMTHSDGLTGLANRRYLDEYLYTEWQRATRDQQPFSLLMMDIDAFKQYNDTYGHLAGDEALRQVAATIRAGATRATDLAARFGGEEFALVLPATSPGGARLIAEKIRLDVERMAIPHCMSPTTGSLTLSIGVATLVPQRDQPVDLVVELGDQALYQAKREGRNRVVGMGE